MRPRFQNTYNEKNDKRQNTPMISKKHNKKKTTKKQNVHLLKNDKTINRTPFEKNDRNDKKIKMYTYWKDNKNDKK